MSTAGYSGTPLPRKLGLKPGMQVAWLGAPEHFADLLGLLPDGVRVKTRASAPLDLVVLFVTRRAELARRLPALRARWRPTARSWAAWPKRASAWRPTSPRTWSATSRCRSGSLMSRSARSTRPGPG